MRINFVNIIAVSLLLCTAPLAAMDKETYLMLEVKSMELTLEGMIKQKNCLEGGGCGTSELIRISEDTQEKIHSLYLEADTTPSEAALFYTRHSKEIDPLYREGEIARKLESIKTRLSQEDEEIKTLLESAR